ncbi:MAG: hypothetical protein WC943_10010 [Elusimicrobiota bacterium]
MAHERLAQETNPVPGGVRHAMANAVACVLGNLEIALRLPASDPRVLEAVEAAMRSAQRLSELMKGVRAGGEWL